MGKTKVSNWLVGFVVCSLCIVTILYLVYLYKPNDYKLPKFNWIEIGLTFIIGFFPSVLSRFVSNIKVGQVEATKEGFIGSIRDSVYGWVTYYPVFIACFLIYDYIVWAELPHLPFPFPWW